MAYTFIVLSQILYFDKSVRKANKNNKINTFYFCFQSAGVVHAGHIITGAEGSDRAIVNVIRNTCTFPSTTSQNAW